MKEKLFTLCDTRKVFITNNETEEFVKFANEKGVYPAGGIMYEPEDKNNPIPGEYSQCFYLDDPITKEEAFVIADKHGLLGEVEHLINRGYSPFDALAEWDLCYE